MEIRSEFNYSFQSCIMKLRKTPGAYNNKSILLSKIPPKLLPTGTTGKGVPQGADQYHELKPFSAFIRSSASL